MCYACERRETVVVNISLRASRSPFSFSLSLSLSLFAREEPEDFVALYRHNAHSHGPPRRQLPIAAGKVSSVYKTINYTYLI